MAEPKTKMTKASVTDFIRRVPNEKKREDSLALLKLFKDITKETPRMWGSSIIGFGLFHYKSEKSAQEGDWMLTGFSPRAQNLTLYVLTWNPSGAGGPVETALLKKLGKHKRGGGCLYINKLEDVKITVLKQLIRRSYETKKKKYKA